MWKNLLGIAAIIASCALFVSSLSMANAQIGPSVNLGSNPWRSFSGETNINSDVTLLTLSSDEEFIVTTMISEGDWQWCGLKAGSDIVLHRSVYGSYRSDSNAITSGRAHIRIPAGSELKVHGAYPSNTSSKCYYYVDGYYVRP